MEDPGAPKPVGPIMTPAIGPALEVGLCARSKDLLELIVHCISTIFTYMCYYNSHVLIGTVTWRQLYNTTVAYCPSRQQSALWTSMASAVLPSHMVSYY